MKKLGLMLLIVMMTVLHCSTSSFAAEPDFESLTRIDMSAHVQKRGIPLMTESYEDDEAIYTERVLFIPGTGMSIMASKEAIEYNRQENAIVTKSVSGNGTYINYKTRTDKNSGLITTYYAKGYFIWGNGAVSVSNPSGGYWFNQLPKNVTIRDQSTTTSGGGLITKYKSVTYSFTYDQKINSSKMSVTVKVYANGTTS